MAFKRVGLMGAHRNPEVKETLAYVATFLQKQGKTVVIETESGKGLAGGWKHAPAQSLSDEIELLVAVGGDGNLLHAARTMSLQNIPVVGINRGQLGFLADLSPDNVEGPLLKIVNGEYVTEERFLLSGTVLREEGSEYGQGNALNDVVLFPGDVAQMIEFEMRINDQFVYSQRSDGLIIATPTGSTAYALSAGGPIIAPHLEVMVLVPKLPHTLTSRPVVIDAASRIEIRLANYNKTAPRLSYDGQSHVSLNLTDRVVIHRQRQPLKILHPQSYDYYAVWREKLHWGRQLIALK